MTPEEMQAYKDQVFGNNGQSVIQSPKPEEPKSDPVDPKNAAPAANPPVASPPPANDEEEEYVDPDVYLKEQTGLESWDAAKSALQELQQLRQEAKTPKQIQYANEQSKLLHEAILAGKEDVVYDILDTQRRIAGIENMKAADAIKLHIQQTNKHFKHYDIEDVFEERYAYPDKPIQNADEADADFSIREQKWKAAAEKIDRRIERDAATAKMELQKLKAELKLPEIEKPAPNPASPAKTTEEDEKILAKMVAEDKIAYSKLTPKDIAMVFKFSDEANKLAFDISYEAEKENFDKAIAEASDLKTFLESYYNKDGSPDRVRFAKDVYVARNIDKIVSEALVTGVNHTIKWFLANQKNIGDRTQRQIMIQQPSEIDKLKEQVFGKTG